MAIPITFNGAAIYPPGGGYLWPQWYQYMKPHEAYTQEQHRSRLAFCQLLTRLGINI